MRTTVWVLLIFCSGCGMTPADRLSDLYVEHAQCLDADAIGCAAIWDEIERRERAAAKRGGQRDCPRGTASVGDALGPAACVSHAEVHSLLRQMLR